MSSSLNPDDALASLVNNLQIESAGSGFAVEIAPPAKVYNFVHPSAVSTCPRCFTNIQLPPQSESTTHPVSLGNDHIDVEAFKKSVNAAIARRLQTDSYDFVKAMLFNWEANDMGDMIFKETKELKSVFESVYRFDASYHLIPSKFPQEKMQMLLGTAAYEIKSKATKNESGLLIVYYNGHGTIKDGHLIFSA